MTATQPPADCFRADLSPEAQAVKDAAWASFWSNEAMAPNDAEIVAAAALRALEEQLAQDKPGPMSRDLEIVVLTERIRMLRKITDIAAELEGQS